jgi:hypothetical protein
MKRLLFPKHEAVDGLWSTIAQSVAAGPLKDAGVFLTKVAPTPSSARDFVSQSEGSADVDHPCNLSVCARYLRSRSGQEGPCPTSCMTDGRSALHHSRNMASNRQLPSPTCIP